MNKIYDNTIEPINVLNEPNFGYRKEYFRHKNTLLFHGDTLNTELFDREFIDLTITSPPYNVGIAYHSNDDELSYENYSAEWRVSS